MNYEKRGRGENEETQKSKMNDYEIKDRFIKETTVCVCICGQFFFLCMTKACGNRLQDEKELQADE